MKKFFLFIGAMMLAVTMQATLVTENVALSDFAQGSASSWNASTGAMSTDGEWHGITKDFGESPLDVSAFCRAKLTLASEPAEGVTVHLYVTDPQGATTGASISHGSTSAILSLQADQVQSIDIKIQQAGSVTISSVEFIGVYGSHTEINLLTEAKSMPGNYAVATDGVACFDKTELASAHEGDVLKVTYEQIANGTAYAFIIGDHSAWQGILDHYEGNSSTVTHY